MDRNSAEILYSEYMQHARHIETQRQAFATVFTAVFGGVIVIASNASSSQNQVSDVVSIFLTVFSLFGFFISAVWNASFVKFTRLAEHIAISEFDTPLQYQRFSKHRKILSAARIFIAFYSLMIGLSSTMLLGNALNIFQKSLTLCGLTASMIFVYLIWVERRVRAIDRLHRQFSIEKNGRRADDNSD